MMDSVLESVEEALDVLDDLFAKAKSEIPLSTILKKFQKMGYEWGKGNLT